MIKIIDRLIAAVLALGLIVAGLLTAVEIILGLLGRHPWIVPHDRWYLTFTTSDWTPTWLRTIASIACVAGVVLILLQLGARRPSALEMRCPEPSMNAWVDRRSVERTLERAARGIDGIGSAKARLRSDRATVNAVASRHDTTDLAARVEQVVLERIQWIELQERPRLSVRVQRRKSS